MPFLLYEQEASGLIKTIADLSPPVGANFAMLQAFTQDIRYTMDGTTTPTATVGMLLETGAAPEQFSIEDMMNIQFIQVTAGAGVLSVHWAGGRAI